jgi:hypothetical protein
MITLRNIHTNDTYTLELVSHKFTWQNVWVVRWNGTLETLSSAQGWTEVKNA